ncbi:MAG: hypothetical protein GXY83_19430 [Rhodopirellula sp.]|nr:hypothetical protein [Rhodopirellula sp.]
MMSYTAKASLALGEGAAVAESKCSEFSREDFIRALRILSTKTAEEQSRFDLGEYEVEQVQVAYLRCRYEKWREIFGDPESTEEHRDALPMFPVQVWHYRCADGPLACVGHQVDDLYGTRWVTFVRLCYF